MQRWWWPPSAPPLSPRCCECSTSLSHQYYEKDGQLFCKKDYWARYGESCHGCSEHITKGLVMVSHFPLPACLLRQVCILSPPSSPVRPEPIPSSVQTFQSSSCPAGLPCPPPKRRMVMTVGTAGTTKLWVCPHHYRWPGS